MILPIILQGIRNALCSMLTQHLLSNCTKIYYDFLFCLVSSVVPHSRFACRKRLRLNYNGLSNQEEAPHGSTNLAFGVSQAEVSWSVSPSNVCGWPLRCFCSLFRGPEPLAKFSVKQLTRELSDFRHVSRTFKLGQVIIRFWQGLGTLRTSDITKMMDANCEKLAVLPAECHPCVV